MNRSDIKKTPGRILYQSTSFLAKLGTNIEETPVLNTFDVGTDAAGPLGKRWQDAFSRVRITPEGRLGATRAGILYPTSYLNPTIGTGIFNDTDRPLAIHGSDASIKTFTAAALEEMPMLTFSAKETLLGPATFLCLRGNNMDWDDANSLATQAGSGGSATDAGFSPDDILTQPYQIDIDGLTGFSDLQTMDGIRLEFRLEFDDDEPDAHGLLNRRIKTVGARVRFIPVGPTATQALNALLIQGTGAGRGKALAKYSTTITGLDGTAYVNLPAAHFVAQAERWGSAITRVGECALECVRNVASGVPGAVATMYPA